MFSHYSTNAEGTKLFQQKILQDISRIAEPMFPDMISELLLCLDLIYALAKGTMLGKEQDYSHLFKSKFVDAVTK